MLQTLLASLVIHSVPAAAILEHDALRPLCPSTCRTVRLTNRAHRTVTAAPPTPHPRSGVLLHGVPSKGGTG